MTDGIAPGPLANVERWDTQAERLDLPCGDGVMVWRQWGAGRKLLLLHGGTGSWRHWIRNLDAFVPGHRVLAPDLPGLGESSLPPMPWTVPGIASLVAENLDRLLQPGETIDVMGFSFGALIAGGIAAQMGRRIGTVILVGASGLGFPRGDVRLETVRDKVDAARTEAHRANLASLMFADPARIGAEALAIQAWNSDHARLRSVGYSATPVLLDAIRNVPAHLCAIWGTRDAVTLPNLEQRVALLRSLQTDADIRTIEGAGHWVAYEAADQFNATVAQMLGR